MSDDFVLSVLRIVADADDCDGIWWTRNDEDTSIRFYVGCNDVFAWGTADAEEITPQNLALLQQTYADVEPLMHCSAYAGMLFCARVRQMRPQGCCYPKESALWPLFDACGPKREISFGNPHEHPADGGQYAYKKPSQGF